MHSEFQTYIIGRCADLSKRLSRVEKRTDGKGKSDYYESKQSCLDAALEMLQQCVDQQEPPPQELVTLTFECANAPGRFRTGDAMDTAVQRRVAEYFGVELSNLPKLQQAAAFEAEHEQDTTGKNPSVAAVSEVAARAKVDRQTIRAWRSLDNYKELVKRGRV